MPIILPYFSSVNFIKEYINCKIISIFNVSLRLLKITDHYFVLLNVLILIFLEEKLLYQNTYQTQRGSFWKFLYEIPISIIPSLILF